MDRIRSIWRSWWPTLAPAARRPRAHGILQEDLAGAPHAVMLTPRRRAAPTT